jgi:lipoate-protein ligase A
VNNYRLIVNKPANGPWNMAVDEAILEAVSCKEAMPTLRLYAWQPACLSLGYSQSIQDVDLQCLKERGWGIVRRLTGGRAILHADELTYALIAPTDEALVGGSLLESYNRIAGGLLKALEILGLPVEINAHTPGLNTNAAGPVCFEMPSAYEITFRGKKLIGSAQARRKQGVLQHGSFPLYGDLGRIIQVLTFSGEGERQEALERLMNRATNAETVSGKNLDWDFVAKVFIEAFSSKLDLCFVEGELSTKELNRVHELVETKYSQNVWTGRV